MLALNLDKIFKVVATDTGRKVPCPLVGNAYKMAMKFVISATFHT